MVYLPKDGHRFQMTMFHNRQEADIQQLIAMHDNISALPKNSLDVPCQCNQLFYVCLIMFLHSMHGYMSAVEPALAGSEYTSASTANLSLSSPRPDTNFHCENMDTGLVHYTDCLFTPKPLGRYQIVQIDKGTYYK